MSEREFWQFLEKCCETGRADAIIGSVDSDNPTLQAAGNYMQGHALLPRDYDNFRQDDILGMGSLLFRKEVSYRAKEAAIMILAHQSSEVALVILAKYNLAPDRGLEFFAKMALEECAMWNE